MRGIYISSILKYAREVACGFELFFSRDSYKNNAVEIWIIDGSIHEL